MKLETIAIKAGRPAEAAGDVAPAIHVSTIFERAADGDFPGGHHYARNGNPTRALLE